MNKRSALLAGSSIFTIAAFTSFLPISAALGDVLPACSATDNTEISGSTVTSVIKEGSSTCTITGDATLTGNTMVEEGTLNFKGGAFSHSDADVIVGTTSGKSGKLVISEGGEVSANSGTLGDLAGSAGEMVVTGENSSWKSNGPLLVGNNGNGTLTVEKGAEVISGPFSAIGWGAGSTGSATITGAGSEWTATEWLDIGSAGKGTLTISDGGKLTGELIQVGYDETGEGTLNVSHEKSSVNLSDDLFLAFYGKGTIAVSDGGNVTSRNLLAGTNAGSDGKITIAGQDSSVDTGIAIIGRSGKAELTVSDGGRLTSSSIRIGEKAGSEGVVTIAGSNAVLDSGQIGFGSGKAVLNFSHSDTNYEFSGALTSNHYDTATRKWLSGKTIGTHEIHQTSGTTLLTGDNSLFAGTTYVDGGKLLVGNSAGVGTLGGDISVRSGGILGGSGTIGTADAHSIVTVGSGGMLAPGNSIGTLTINGDLNLLNGSVFAVEIAGNGRGDLVVVNGNAALAGTVQVTALDDRLSYQDGVTYRFLDATTTTGSFAGVVSESAFLDLGLTEDGVGALVKVGFRTPDEPLFATVAQTQNQVATSTALDGLDQHGKSLALYNNILILGAQNARNAFDQLSGEIHASAKSALIENAQLTQNAVNNRLRSAFADASHNSNVAALGYGPETSGKKSSAFDVVASTDKAQAGYGAWTQGFGRWSKKEGNGNVGDFKTSTGGFVAGVDSVVAENWRLGILAGYSHTSFHANERASSGDSENYTLGTYAGSQWELPGGTLSFSTGLAYTWHQLETNRAVAFNNFSDSLSADYKAATVQAFGELGYKVIAGRAAYEPYANLAYTHLKTDSFSETGATAAALSVNSDTMDTTFTTLGMRASTAFDLGGVSSTARADIGWRHAYGDVTPSSSAQFIGSSLFSVAGTALAKDVATLEAGLDFDLTKSAKLGVSYNGQFGSGAHQNGFNVKLGVSF